MVLAQVSAAASTADSSLATHLTQIGVGLILALTVWMAGTLVKVMSAMKQVSEWAFGRDAASGVDARVRASEAVMTVRGLELLQMKNDLVGAHTLAESAETKAQTAWTLAHDAVARNDTTDLRLDELEKDSILLGDRTHFLNDALTPLYVHAGIPLPDRRHFRRRSDDS